MESLDQPAQSATAAASPRPLCVDLDGTLVDTDMVYECFLQVVRRTPWLILWMPRWILRGKQIFKLELARRSRLNFASLPYNSQVLAYLRDHRDTHCSCILVTGTNELVAQGVADHLQLFDGVLASDRDRNLTGRTKARVLAERYGKQQFDYLGNSHVDGPVWANAYTAVSVCASPRVAALAAAKGVEHTHLPMPRPTWRDWLSAVCLHDWGKNLVLFVPLITAQRILELPAVLACTLAFLCFGLVASGTSIINDLFHLEAARLHPQKRRRPFAAGTLSIRSGMAASLLLVAAGLSLALVLPLGFGACLATFLVARLSYSLVENQGRAPYRVLLASLYPLRVLAGGWAIGVTTSFGLLALTMLVFLGLAFVKRDSE